MFPAQEKNGYWYVYYPNPKTSKRTKKSARVKSALGSKMLVKVMQFFVKFQKEYERIKEGGIKSISLSEFREIFITYKRNYVTSQTLTIYNYELKQFDKFLNGKVKINEIRQHHLDSYSNYLFNQLHAPANIQKKFVILFATFNYAIRNKYISKEIDLERPRITVPEYERTTINEIEFLKLLDNCDDLDLKDIITVGYQTGMRKGELMNIEWQHVNLEQEFFNLNNTTFLTKSRQMRIISMNDSVIEIIKRRLYNNNQKYVFTNNTKKWTRTVLQRKFAEVVVKTFGTDSGITIHSLRHSFATNLVDKDVSDFKIQKLLGHANISTTQIYSHARQKGLKEAVDKIDIKNMKLVNKN